MSIRTPADRQRTVQALESDDAVVVDGVATADALRDCLTDAPTDA